MTIKPHPRLTFVVNHCSFFVSHRLALAIGAREAGFGVRLLTGQPGSHEMEIPATLRLQLTGISHQRAVFTSAGLNPFVELAGLIQLGWFMLTHRPDIVHCASPKGLLYGGIAARLCRVKGLVLAISGMGYAHTQDAYQSTSRTFVRKIYNALAHFSFKHPNVRVIVQNKDDYQSIINSGLAKASAVRLIPGSGVDLSLFDGVNPVEKSTIVLLPARILKDKGVEEFVEAARQLRAVAPGWQFVLAGAAGYDNPSAIDLRQINAWQAEGCVQWLGHVEDMTPLFRKASIVCLPSYREGMPKALLEAAAAGCAVVTTDVTGCREAIEPGVTGDLVPVRDSSALAKALLKLINNEDRRHSYGRRGMERASLMFSIEAVVDQTLDIYKELLHNE